MTSIDTLHDAKFDEARALRKRMKELEDLIRKLEAENEQLRTGPQPKKKTPPQHPGQTRIEGT